MIINTDGIDVIGGEGFVHDGNYVGYISSGGFARQVNKPMQWALCHQTLAQMALRLRSKSTANSIQPAR